MVSLINSLWTLFTKHTTCCQIFEKWWKKNWVGPKFHCVCGVFLTLIYFLSLQKFLLSSHFIRKNSHEIFQKMKVWSDLTIMIFSWFYFVCSLFTFFFQTFWLDFVSKLCKVSYTYIILLLTFHSRKECGNFLIFTIYQKPSLTCGIGGTQLLN